MEGRGDLHGIMPRRNANDVIVIGRNLRQHAFLTELVSDIGR
jgi:hypothetical protein